MNLVIWTLWLLAAPPPGGACANPADHGWLAAHHETVSDIAEGCAFDCLTDDAACAARCMSRETALSAPCTGCFGVLIDCTTSNCAMRCVFPSTDLCLDCRAAHCEAEFERCGGVPIRR